MDAIYIKMCKAALEVQARWQPTDGDRFVLKAWAGWTPYLWTQEGWYCPKSHEFLLRVGDSSEATTETEVAVWLPYQHQLQAMVPIEKEPRQPFLLRDFMSFAKWRQIRDIQNFIRYRSLEQLWLAFIMWKLHRKKWDGESWVKEPVLAGRR